MQHQTNGQTEDAAAGRASLVCSDDIFTWWDVMFRHAGMVATPDTMIEVRKIGTRDGELFQESMAVQPWNGEVPDAEALRFLGQRVVHAAENGVGVFMAPALLNDRKANDQSVTHLVGVTVDLDTGDTMAKLTQLINMGLKPTMVVASGGITKEEHAKLHIHYRLSEPCDEPWKVAHVREVIAHRVGDDGSFKRIPQVVRIPGSVYDKNAEDPKPVRVLDVSPDTEYDLTHFCDVLGIDFNNIPAEFMWSDQKQGVAGEFKDPAVQHDKFLSDVTNVVHAGAVDKEDRFTVASRHIGNMIFQARIGTCTLEEAYRSVSQWNQTNVSPPWPQDRMDREFQALLLKDQKDHADSWAQKDKAAQPVEVASPGKTAGEWTLRDFVAKDKFRGVPPPVAYIVDNFLIENNVHALVADGGVGKTYMALDLALRIAIGPSEKFLCFPIKKRCAAVVLTVEDTGDDIHRRLHNMDPEGTLRDAAGDWLYIVPVREEIRGGLTLMEKDLHGNFKPSKAWEFLVAKIAQVREDHPGAPILVVIDTYSATHHSNENDSVGTNEWFRSAGLLSNEYQSAILVTHHVRKNNPDAEIKTVSDFKGEIRGSGAFPASCRAVFGVWEMPNQKGLKNEAAAEDEAQLFNLGLIKKNGEMDWSHMSNPKYPDPIITLRRRGDGALIFDAHIHHTRLHMGEKRKGREAAAVIQLKAAVLKAVELFSAAGYPLAARNLTHEFAQFLPKEVHGVSNARREIITILDEALNSGILVKTKVKGKNGEVLDVPTGEYALGSVKEKSPRVPSAVFANYVYDEASGEYVPRA